jgi:hypothetical protein
MNELDKLSAHCCTEKNEITVQSGTKKWHQARHHERHRMRVLSAYRMAYVNHQPAIYQAQLLPSCRRLVHYYACADPNKLVTFQHDLVRHF